MLKLVGVVTYISHFAHSSKTSLVSVQLSGPNLQGKPEIALLMDRNSVQYYLPGDQITVTIQSNEEPIVKENKYV